VAALSGMTIDPPQNELAGRRAMRLSNQPGAV
jgi:hypothetical protein